MSGEFDSRKDSHSTKFKRRPRIFLKINFWQLCHSNLSCLHPFDNMTIIHWVKNRPKTEKLAVRSWNTNRWSNFCDPHWELTFRNKWHPGTLEISTPPEIAVETHFHARNGTKTTLVFLSADGETSWLLFPKSISLLSGGTLQPKNTYSCILKVTSWVWETQKRQASTLITTTISVYLPKPVSTDLTIKPGSILTNPIRKAVVKDWLS